MRIGTHVCAAAHAPADVSAQKALVAQLSDGLSAALSLARRTGDGKRIATLPTHARALLLSLLRAYTELVKLCHGDSRAAAMTAPARTTAAPTAAPLPSDAAAALARALVRPDVLDLLASALEAVVTGGAVAAAHPSCAHGEAADGVPPAHACSTTAVTAPVLQKGDVAEVAPTHARDARDLCALLSLLFNLAYACRDELGGARQAQCLGCVKRMLDPLHGLVPRLLSARPSAAMLELQLPVLGLLRQLYQVRPPH